MTRQRFTKCLSVFLSLCMVLSGLAFAAPALEPVQDSEEQSAETEAVVTTELMEKGIKPGLNMLNQTTSEWTFEEGMTDYASVLSLTHTATVASNPVGDDVNPSGSVLKMSVSTASDSYPAIAFNPPSPVESDRPVYVSFKYLKTYEPKASETIKSEGALWVMKNGSGYIAKSVGGFDPNAGWKQYSGLIDFNKAYNAGKPSDINTSPISSIRIQAKALANDGKTIFAYDDIMMMPSYKISYMLNDGTDSVVSSSYFLFEEDGTTLMTSYSPDLTLTPADRYGYIFKGWSLNADSAVADAPASVTLANEDIVLYAVWKKDEDAPEPTTYKWDFEDNTTQTWSTANTGYSMTVQNGYITVNTNAASYVGTPYLRHGGVSLDTKAHRYLVVKARSRDTVSNIKFYFTTSNMSGPSEAATVQIPIDQGSKVFKEYYVDMSQNALWTGNYQSCMFQLNKGNGIVDIEEIYFTTLYDQPEQQVYEYHYPNSKLSAWGHTAITTNDDGTVKITRSGDSTQGAMNIAAPDGTLEGTVYNKMVIKAKNNSGITGFRVYYSTEVSGGYSEANTLSSTLLSIKDGDYSYYLVDFSGRTNYSGAIKTFMISVNGIGSMDVADVYLTNEVTGPKDAEVEKVALYASVNEITEEGGTVNLTPYVRYTDGTETTGARYVTDSVNALLTKNADGTATLTGKMNGDITVTAFVDGTTQSFSQTIAISGQSEKIAANSFKLLTYGNSIMNHGPSESIGWYGSWGMAASSKEKDYVHRLIYYLGQKYGDENISHAYGTSLATFERAIPADAPDYDYSAYTVSMADIARIEQPDIITIQIGENVSSGPTAETYENAITQFVEALQEAAPDAMIVVCTPFWGGTSKIEGMKNTAAKLDLPIALLHTLNTDENMALGLFEHAGVASHPGDTGMDNIAKLLFEQINARLSENERTVYTTIPKSVEFTSTVTSITEVNGTAQLSAHVLPLDAAQGITWTTSNKDIASVTADGLVTAVNNGTVTITATSRYNQELTASINIEISGQTIPYTVTYNANTSDTVTGMPEPNPLAKENFVFDAVYPVRETYKFLGWALTPDGEVVSGPIDVTENITVYAQWELASSWSFNTDGYKENFTVLNGFNQYVLNGKFMSVATGTDVASGNVLKVVSPTLALNPADYYALVITMQNTEINSSTALNLTVKTTDGDFPFTTKVTTRDYFTYAFILSDVTGTITGFEFTPTNLDCTINLDEIAFMGEPIVKYDANTSDAVSGMPAGVYYDSELPTVLSDIVPVRTGYTFLGWTKKPDSKLLLSADTVVTAPTTFYAVWDKNDHWEFDTSSGVAVSNVDAGKTTYTDGVLHYETTSSTDPIVTPSAIFGYPVSSTSGKIEIRMKWTATSAMISQIFFKTTTATALSEANSAKTHLSTFGQSVDDYQSVIVDFTSNSGWAGNLTYLRFDCTSYYGTTDVDYIRFTNSEANIVTDAGQTRKVVSDWASYIVKEGGTLAPQGETALNALYLSGDVDMTNGYILLTGDYEIADSAEYAVFTLNMAEQNITAGSYMYLAGYDKPVTMVDGGKYLVKLDNGVGFVYFGNENDVSQKTVYKVTKSGAQLSEDAFTATDTAVSVRVKEPVGVRFRAMVANRVIAATVENDGFAVKEFGFLVSTGSLMSDPVANLNMAAVDAGIAKKGINYGEDVSVFYGVTDENVIITAALVGIPETKAAYTTKLYVRPYMILDNGVVIYGTPITDTVYDIAYRLLDLIETGEEDYVDFVESVIAIVES